MKNFIIDLSKTPLRKLQGLSFKYMDFNSFINETHDFIKDLNDFNKKNPDITICTKVSLNTPFGYINNTINPLIYSFNNDEVSLKCEDFLFKEDLKTSQVILFGTERFSTLIKNKKNNDFYVVNNNHSLLELEYYKNNKLKNYFYISKENDVNKFFDKSKNEKNKFSNLISFDSKSIFRFIRKELNYIDDIYFIKFYDQRSQFDEAIIENGKIKSFSLNDNASKLLSENLKNKYKNITHYSYEEIKEISNELKDKYELNILNFDKSPWEFLDVDETIYNINEVIKNNINQFYFLPEKILQIIQPIYSDLPNNQKNEYNLVYNSLHLEEHLGINPDKDYFANINLEVVEEIFNILKDDYDLQSLFVKSKQLKNKTRDLK